MKKNVNKVHHKNKKKKIVKKAIKKIIKKMVKMVVRSKIKAKPKAKIMIKTKTRAKVTSKVKAKVKAKTKTKTVPLPVAHHAPKKIVTQSHLLSRSQTVLGPVNVKPYQATKNEQYMNEKQLEHFRQVLLQWKSQLMAEVDRTMHHMQEEVSNYPDPIDRASQEEEFSLELRARDRERKLLRKIEEALNRINDHDYGYCDDCGAEIGIRRLEARPTATQCIECKTVSEIREKQIGESSVFD